MSQNFCTVTELAGDDVSVEQLERLAHRYYWAGEYCRNKDVLEIACGAGQGLGYLAALAKSLVAGDITPALVSHAKQHYGDRVAVTEMDAMQLPFPDGSLDVIILFEAIYYLPSAEQFSKECHRVLRAGGHVLIATANKDLYDFNPSPQSRQYYGTVELGKLFHPFGFKCEFFGHMPVEALSLRQKILRPIKKLVVGMGLMPKTMAGKKLLKRLVFGRLVQMPPEIDEKTASYVAPNFLSETEPDRRHKVIYMAACLQN